MKYLPISETVADQKLDTDNVQRLLALQSSCPDVINSLINTLNVLPGKVKTGKMGNIEDFRSSALTKKLMYEQVRSVCVKRFQAKYS